MNVHPLLERAIAAAGGLEKWQRIRELKATMSSGGACVQRPLARGQATLDSQRFAERARGRNSLRILRRVTEVCSIKQG
jgi:hypothetical protein